jgi:ParB family transcriptional regulator, chromosome partitioning protein
MAQRKSGLGKGLGALLASREDASQLASDNKQPPAVGSIALVNLDSIEVNPWQPRNTFEEVALNELAHSISTLGIVQPITVRTLDNGKYQLISGERRYRASQMIGMKTIPAFIRSTEDFDMLELALVENLHRADLNAIELAFSYQRLMEDCNLTQDQLAERISKKRETISNYVRLLKLPEEIQSGIIEGQIEMGHARALINVNPISLQLEIFRQVKKDNLSVRATEALVKSATGNPSPNKPTIKKYNPTLGSWAGKAKAQVTVSAKGNGNLSIRFSSEQELKELLDRLS